MARKPRIEYEGAVYHVIVRGNQKQVVFHDKHDYKKYLSLLTSYKERTKFSLYAYVLMENHMHLLLETGKVPLSKIMQGLNQGYTMYYNRKYSKVGHLFQGRYKAIICDLDSYLVALVRYLHLNPVRAGIVEKPENYEWSGHCGYLGKNNNSLLDEDTVLRIFAEHKGASRRLYRKFVELAIGEKSNNEYYSGEDTRVLGDEIFLDQVMKQVDENSFENQKTKKVDLDMLSLAVERVTGVPVMHIIGKGQSLSVSRARHVFVVAGVELGHRGKDIATCLNRDPASVSRCLRGSEQVHEEVKTILKKVKCPVSKKDASY